MVENLPGIQETQAASLGHEDPLEKGMATCSSILAWEIPWTKEPSGLQSMGSQYEQRNRIQSLLTWKGVGGLGHRLKGL